MEISKEEFRQTFLQRAAEIEAACGDWEHAEVDQEILDRMKERALARILKMENEKEVDNPELSTGTFN